MDSSNSSCSLQADRGVRWGYVNHITTLQKKLAQKLKLKKKRNTKTEPQTKQTNQTDPIGNQTHAYPKSRKTQSPSCLII